MNAIPYPSETRAKGWRLEIDHERIRQSDTWALAAPDVKPWLLMLWMVAWEQTPCGSLPAEDELIAARIGMTPKVFAKHRDVLMRGWWIADDGRLYHNVLVQRVSEMLAKRAKDAERAAKARANRTASQSSHADVTRDAPVTHALPTREFDTKHQAVKEEKEPPNPPMGGLPEADIEDDKSPGALTFKAWTKSLKAKSEKAIPADDPVFRYCDEVGIPHEFLAYHWHEFKARYLQVAKRQRDWRAQFRNSVRGNWMHVWTMPNGSEIRLTTVGEQARRAIDAAEHREAA